MNRAAAMLHLYFVSKRINFLKRSVTTLADKLKEKTCAVIVVL